MHRWRTWSSVPGDTTRGWEDAVIGAKVKLADEGAVMPAVGLRFATRLPNASNETGLGLDTMDFFQSLLVGKTVQSIRLVGNIGVGILSDPTRGDRQNDVLTYGVSVARGDNRRVGDRRRAQRAHQHAAGGRRRPARRAAVA